VRAWFLTLPLQLRIASGLLAAGMLLLLWLLFSPLLAWNQASLERMDQARPRIGRLAGIEGSGDELRAALQASRMSIEQFLHRRQAGNASIGSSAQQQLRELAESAGFRVQGSQLMEPRQEEGVLDTRVDVDLVGDLESLTLLLEALAVERPLLLARELNLAPVAVRRGQEPTQQVSAKLVVSAFSLPDEGDSS
jgi:hypothetical protein